MVKYEETIIEKKLAILNAVGRAIKNQNLPAQQKSMLPFLWVPGLEVPTEFKLEGSNSLVFSVNYRHNVIHFSFTLDFSGFCLWASIPNAMQSSARIEKLTSDQNDYFSSNKIDEIIKTVDRLLISKRLTQGQFSPILVSEAFLTTMHSEKFTLFSQSCAEAFIDFYVRVTGFLVRESIDIATSIDGFISERDMEQVAIEVSSVDASQAGAIASALLSIGISVTDVTDSDAAKPGIGGYYIFIQMPVDKDSRSATELAISNVLNASAISYSIIYANR